MNDIEGRQDADDATVQIRAVHAEVIGDQDDMNAVAGDCALGDRRRQHQRRRVACGVGRDRDLRKSGGSKQKSRQTEKREHHSTPETSVHRKISARPRPDTGPTTVT